MKEENLLHKARILIDLKRYEEAEKWIKSYLSRAVNDSSGLALLSVCKLHLGEYGDAIEFAKNSNAQEVNYQAIVVLVIAYYHSKNNKKLKETIKTGKSIYPYGYQFYLYEAYLEKDNHRYKKATRIVDKGLEIASDNIRLHNLRGELLSLRGKTKQAKIAFDTALSLNPNHPQTHNNQGWLALEKGHYEEAENFFLSALRRDPNHFEGAEGYELVAKSKLSWFRPFIRYLAYVKKAAPMIGVGVLAGITSQAGKIVTTSWDDPWFFYIFATIVLGIVLFFWIPMAFSSIATIQLANQSNAVGMFGEEEKKYAHRNLLAFGFTSLVFIILLTFL